MVMMNQTQFRFQSSLMPLHLSFAVTQVIPVNPNVVLRASCPLQRLVDENPIHECNDRSTCGDGKLCCANRHNKGRCTQVLANQISENVGKEAQKRTVGKISASVTYTTHR